MTYSIRQHPLVRSDLRRIGAWVAGFAGDAAAGRRLGEFDAFARRLAEVPHKGTIRDDVAPGVRAIPAGPALVVAFVVDDARREVLILVVSHGGSDWFSRARERA